MTASDESELVRNMFSTVQASLDESVDDMQSSSRKVPATVQLSALSTSVRHG